jgi:hypothetical protein
VLFDDYFYAAVEESTSCCDGSLYILLLELYCQFKKFHSRYIPHHKNDISCEWKDLFLLATVMWEGNINVLYSVPWDM